MQKTGLTVRQIETKDFESLTKIHNSHNEPDFHTTPEKMRLSHESSLKNDRHYKRVVAAFGETVVGTAIRCSCESDKRGHYWLDLSVHENHRLAGIEKQMVNEILEGAVDGKPTHLWNCIRSDFNRSVEFLTDYGFEEVFRSWGSHLDLTKFELENFKPLISKLGTEGLRFSSYTNLIGLDKEAKLLKLHKAIEDDTPYFEPIIPKRREDIRSPYVPNEACFVALDGDEIIGMAGLDIEHGVQNSLTGVARPYRNRGIATALKALVADYAKSQGEVDINAAGSGKNSSMLKVNVKLGFYIEPAWITSCADLRKLA